MKLDIAKALWNRYKTRGVDWMFIPSFEEPRATVRDAASRGSEVTIEAADIGDDWDFERMVSADELVVS